MSAMGRCHSCGYNLEPLRVHDEYGHVRGDTGFGRCLSPECTVAYAQQPWQTARECAGEVRDAAARAGLI